MKEGDHVSFTDKFGEELEGTISKIHDKTFEGKASVKCYKKAWQMEVNCLVDLKELK